MFDFSPVSFKWQLLINYLKKYNDTEYYKLVCKRLVKNGYEIPSPIAHLFKVSLSKRIN